MATLQALFVRHKLYSSLLFMITWPRQKSNSGMPANSCEAIGTTNWLAKSKDEVRKSGRRRVADKATNDLADWDDSEVDWQVGCKTLAAIHQVVCHLDHLNPACLLSSHPPHHTNRRFILFICKVQNLLFESSLTLSTLSTVNNWKFDLWEFQLAVSERSRERSRETVETIVHYRTWSFSFIHLVVMGSFFL